MNIVLIIMILLIVFLVLFFIRNEITYHLVTEVCGAISYYNINTIYTGEPRIDFDIEYYSKLYDKTLWCFWRCTCKQLVDADTYQKIKPYLKRR